MTHTRFSPAFLLALAATAGAAQARNSETAPPGTHRAPAPVPRALDTFTPAVTPTRPSQPPDRAD